MKRYLVVAPQGLGDALEATPLVRELKIARPDAAVDVAVLRPGPRELFAGLAAVARVIDLPYWERGSRGFLTSLARNAAVGRYEASFLAYPAARRDYQALAFALGAKRRFAHRYRAPRLGNGLWLNTHLVPVRHAHNVERNLDLLRAAGFAAEARHGYDVPAAWRGGAPASTVAIHAGTVAHDGLEARRWGAGRFVELIDRIRAGGRDVALISGPSERELTQAIARDARVDTIVEGTLAEVARFLSTCALVVANDSGIAHLAAGVGAPVVAIFGPTPVEHGPYGARAYAFRPSACAPCFDPRLLNTACALDIDYACLKRDATVDAVYRACLEASRDFVPLARNGTDR